VKTNTEFAQSLGLDYPILSDPEKTAARSYGVLGLLGMPSRTTFYIDAAGKIAHVDSSVSTSRHGKDIAAKLAELGAPKKAP
jgi:peroxiredoxin Q/BCP